MDAARVEETLGLTVLRRQSKKPKGFDELLKWFNRRETSTYAALDAADFNNGGGAIPAYEPHELCMVGDRSLTDVVFGNVHGMLTVRKYSILHNLRHLVLLLALDRVSYSKTLSLLSVTHASMCILCYCYCRSTRSLLR